MLSNIDIAAFTPSAAALSQAARSLYRGAPRFTHLLQTYRPYICPFEALLQHVPQDATVLDVGCGAGLLLGLLGNARRISSGLGFDSSAPAIQAANLMQRHLAQSPDAPPLEFQRLDATQDWPVGQFTVVALIDVLHHVPPSAQASVIAKTVTRIAPGGLLLYKDMCKQPLWRALANRTHDFLLARQWIHYAPIAQVEIWAQKSGLSLEYAERLNRYWYGHELRVFRRPAL